ncbi:hypothetical protein CJD36_017675 [Flavipsychrobacter stenotrophus]|uniref:Uncharacterized protein n=1 Tax=Flavipsychrobacter stenotrophus TaxID=2077091 RepID=A0A2S7ST25_9BACT|nr:hypothetical protein [Flavipsychrobacter stenotrophus]PQJ09757.1 hypothetical protein CJD36_017675 [Flavipsychrobacter stenotrophus]
MDNQSKNCTYCHSPFVGCRSTRKYCSDRCKQAAFYSRAAQSTGSCNGITPLDSNERTAEEYNNIKDTVPLGFPTDKTDIVRPLPLYEEQPNDKMTFDVKKGDGQSDRGRRSESNHGYGAPALYGRKTKPVKEEQYRWVRSDFIDDIGDYTNTNDMASHMFQYPNKYWYSSDIEKVKWVSIRFRCIIENLLRLDRTIVERKTLITLREAINAMVASRNFKSIPANYPMKNEVVEWQKNIARAAKNADREVRFKLRTENKVKLICLRFQLADIVPFIKFSNLDFTK